MEGKRLYFSTKTCDSTVCQNYHMAVVEKVETNMVALFDIHALNNRIIPKATTLSQATHMQYMDINGTIHIRPTGMVPEALSNIVNFRLLTSAHLIPFRVFSISKRLSNR